MLHGKKQKNLKVAIVSDSATGLPENVLHKYGIATADMTLAFNGQLFRVKPNDPSDFYSRLSESKGGVTTAAPSPSEWVKTFAEATETTNKILCVTVSGQMSSSFSSAKTAAQIISSSNPDVEIKVVDSGTAAGAQALIVLELARLASSGSTLDQLLSKLSVLSEKVELLAVLDTLEYLRKSGRVSGPVSWTTNLLNVKPLVEFKKGYVHSVARSFSREGSVKRLYELVITRSSKSKKTHINVMHADCKEEAESLKLIIDAQLKPFESLLTEFPPFMAAHTGPGLLGIAYYSETSS